jgi:hypothetical protein
VDHQGLDRLQACLQAHLANARVVEQVSPTNILYYTILRILVLCTILYYTILCIIVQCARRGAGFALSAAYVKEAIARRWRWSDCPSLHADYHPEEASLAVGDTAAMCMAGWLAGWLAVRLSA